MRIFSYKITHDTGFAPNPFWGYLTIATCKPLIREKKHIGDWIVGFSSKSLLGESDPVGQEKVVFAMQITEKITYQEYWDDARFQNKIPDMSAKSVVKKCGDNIYQPLKSAPTAIDDFIQKPNPYHDKNDIQNDLKSLYVIISNKFWYFGQKKVSIPEDIPIKVPYRQSSHGVRTHDMDVANRFIKYLSDHYCQGIIFHPNKWPANDESWKKHACNTQP